MHCTQSRSARMTALSALTIAFVVATTVFALENDNWPSFRGADALATAADDPRLPTTWSTTDNVVWKVPIDGLGWSSPVVWGDRIFLTTVVNEGESQEPRMGLYFPFGESTETKARTGRLLLCGSTRGEPNW